MIKDFSLLFKALFKQTFRINKTRDESTKKSKMLILYIFAGICCLPLAAVMVFVAYQVGLFAKQAGLQVEFLTLLITVVQGVVLIFGVFAVLNTIYFSKDNEFLLSLPLKPQTIFGVKLCFAYMIEFITTVFMMIIGLIPFVIGAGLSFSIGLVFSFFITPMLPLLIAAILAIPLMYLVSYFKNKGVFSSIAMALLFIILFAGYFLLVNQLALTGEANDINEIFTMMITAVTNFANVMLPNKWLAISMVEQSFGTAALNFLFVVALNAVLFALAYIISSMVYKRSISKQLENPKSQSNKKIKFETSGKIKMLLKKDFKEIIRYPSLAFYCFFGMIFAPVFIAIFGLNFSSASGSEVADGVTLAALFASIPDLLTVIMLCMATFLLFSTNYTATSALTRENQNFYLIKILPVSYQNFLDAKVLLAFIVNEIALGLFLLVSLIFLSLPLLTIILTAVIGSIISLAFCYVQVYLDLSKPRLNWENITQGLKNNTSSLMSLIISLGIMVVIGGLYALATLAQIEALIYVYFIVLALIGIVTCLAVRKKLHKDCTYLIEKINQ